MLLKRKDKTLLVILLTGFFVLLIGLLTVAPKQAKSHSVFCASREAIITNLLENYGETLLGSGIVPDGRIIEVYVNTLKGTWTLVISSPTGASTCLWASGKNWSFLDDLLPPIRKSLDELDKI